MLTVLPALGAIALAISAAPAYAQPVPPPAECGAWWWVEAAERDEGNTASSGNDYGSTSLFVRNNYWSLSAGQYAVVIEVIQLRSGYNPSVVVAPSGSISFNVGDGQPRRFTHDGINRLSVQSQFVRYRIWFANCDPPTPTPTPTRTPAPTWTPTAGGGGGGSGGGVGTGTPTPTGGGGGGGGEATPSPVPGWCGYVPDHPCWVAWATAQAVRLEGTVTAALDATSVASLAEAVATRVPGAAYAPTITAVADLLAQGPQAAGYSRTSGGIDVSVYGVDIIDVEMYNYECINVDVMNTTICPRYGYIRRLWLGPVEVPVAMVVRAALALAAVAFIVRR